MMEKFMKRGIIRQRGITLIALVITIIVLLILAGVTIAALSGDNGILTRAAESKNRTEEAQEKEGLELAVTSSQMEDVNTLEIDKEKLENAIKQQFGNNKDFSVTDNKDGSFLVNMNDTQRMYYIDETGEIIEQSKMLKISTADELKAFRDDVNSDNTYEGWYVYLTNNITLDVNEEWKPIGEYISLTDDKNKAFRGIFDGCGYEIDGIKTNKDATELFDFVDNGKIMNLGIGENNNIIIVQILANNSKLVNCYNKADIIVGGYRGGLVGSCILNSTIQKCYNLGNISISDSQEVIGGICGELITGSRIYNCFNEGNINVNNTSSNMIGRNSGNCW